ncbi:PTS fructose transporter subunit IIB [Vibrio diazotrophicus]|uniref:PTS fructose transporter subunit IIB n=1 Tax=Vibrio diazotrophicus TaxID=685 RepID=UPI000C9E5786|nr:PTS fructose transporter subunit IIB [Vibrio diazotrophicus]EGR4407264.1 PTS fructose transporter subunit IIB [Vibrio cholerae]PNH83407.1 PTS fructose transporter subunit IIB [Vibrio diazotrophicus]HDG1578308.1 PTS fructose transporter subunit IIB [Vibrio cholerae]
MKIVAVTACPTGIAHTYMAADALVKTANKYHVQIKVETQGAMGIENLLSAQDISNADRVLIVSDIKIEQEDRFDNIDIIRLPIEDALLNPDKIFILHCR